jgi:Exostosin family
MANSKFCLNIAGDTPSSNRLFDAIVSHFVPVIISDEIELPYEDVLDYYEFCVFVRSTDAVRDQFLVQVLRGIRREEWERMWQRLRKVARHFKYGFPSFQGDAVDMILGAVHRKISAIRFDMHRQGRFGRLENSG